MVSSWQCNSMPVSSEVELAMQLDAIVKGPNGCVTGLDSVSEVHILSMRFI